MEDIISGSVMTKGEAIDLYPHTGIVVTAPGDDRTLVLIYRYSDAEEKWVNISRLLESIEQEDIHNGDNKQIMTYLVENYPHLVLSANKMDLQLD